MSHQPHPWGPWSPAQGHPPAHPAAPRDDLMLLWNAARTGAAVGACGAAALNIHRMRGQSMCWQQALSDTAATSLKAGVATAAGAAVGGRWPPSHGQHCGFIVDRGRPRTGDGAP